MAEAAGVSIASVSRVLRGEARVSDSLRHRVAQAVERLDYVPSGAARGLAAGAYQAHGLVLGDLTGDYFPPLALGFESAAARSGRAVVLQVADRRSEPTLAARGLLSRVDALAIGPSALPDAAIRRLARRVPVVVIGRNPVDDCDALLTESTASVRRLVAHLVEHGRRRLRFAGDVRGSWDAAQRAAAFATACREAGLQPAPPLQTEQTGGGGEAVAGQLAAAVRRGEIDAVVCVNDELALALLRRFAEQDLAVPDDVAVTGFDDVPAARYVTPGLTTVRQPVFALGQESAAALERRLATPGAERVVRTLPTELVVRGSCGTHSTEAA